MVDTVVDADVYSSIDDGQGIWGPYWIDTQIAVIVFVDISTDMAFARTDDGGATWSKTVID